MVQRILRDEPVSIVRGCLELPSVTGVVGELASELRRAQSVGLIRKELDAEATADALQMLLLALAVFQLRADDSDIQTRLTRLFS
jgi:hypothetical protein